MNGFLLGLALHSLRISIPALLLMGVTPRLLKRFAARWIYCAWIAVLAAFLLPISLPGRSPFTIALPREEPALLGFAAGGAAPGTAAPAAMAIENTQQRTGISTGIPVFIWAAGAMAAACYHGLRHAAYLRTVKLWKRPVTDAALLDLLESKKRELGISRKIELYRCSCIASPALTGIFHPVILLPDEQHNEDELPYVLKHELIHYKQKDAWIKLMALVATMMHWFNPVVYLAARTAFGICELSCDQAVIDGEDMDNRRVYGMAILCAASGTASFTQTSLSSTRAGKRNMEKRLEGIFDMNRKKKGLIIIIAVAAALLTAMVAVGWSKPGSFSFINRTRMKESILSGIQEGDGSTDHYILWPEGHAGIGALPDAERTQPFRAIDLRYRYPIEQSYRDANGKKHAVRLFFDYDYRLHGEIAAEELNGYIAARFAEFERIFEAASYERILDGWSLRSLFQDCLDSVQQHADPRVEFLYYPSGIQGDIAMDPTVSAIAPPGTFSDRRSFHNLKDGAVVINAQGVQGCSFHTDTGSIVLSFGGEANSGTFHLYDVTDIDNCLQSLTLSSPAEFEKAFTGLSDETVYYIVGEGMLDGAMLKVSSSASQ